MWATPGFPTCAAGASLLSTLLAFGCATGDTSKISIATLTLPETQLVTLSREGAPAVVSGTLSLPRGSAGPRPAVILLHGAGGLSTNLPEWVDELNGIGIATFVLDSFGPRGITETRTGHTRINLGSRVVDAYRALEQLATHPRLDPARIRLLGFSQGGGVVLLARQARFQELWLSAGRPFAAFLAVYPSGCNAKLLGEERASPQPLRIFHGTADDQTIIDPCREYVARLRAYGQDVALLEYRDAAHGFDIRVPVRFQPPVISGRNCTYVEQAPGSFTVTHRDTGAPARPSEPCLSRGITLGHHAEAHGRAVRDVKVFLSTTFGLPP